MGSNHTLFRSRAPLRIGLAGGGTDVSPYCDNYGGAVLNATINLYAYATIQPNRSGEVRFIATDIGQEETLPLAPRYDHTEGLRLHRGVYNRIVGSFNGGVPIPLTMVTSVDSPFGSGLGSSSALTVAMIEAFRIMLQLPLGDYDVAHLAYGVERTDLALAGGRQDQYAATFGGINFMEFTANDRVIVNPLTLPSTILNELESSTLLYFTGQSRSSDAIINRQAAAIRSGTAKSIEAMHQLKREALELKAALLRGEFDEMAGIFNRSWTAKKATASGVTTARIDEVYRTAIEAGALGGKVSGAGGGGFMMFLIDPVDRERISRALSALGGTTTRCAFTEKGATAWSVDRSFHRDARSHVHA